MLNQWFQKWWKEDICTYYDLSILHVHAVVRFDVYTYIYMKIGILFVVEYDSVRRYETEGVTRHRCHIINYFRISSRIVACLHSPVQKNISCSWPTSTFSTTGLRILGPRVSPKCDPTPTRT